MSKLPTILHDKSGNELVFMCPGCEHVHAVRYGEGNGPRWTWNGDDFKPTFSPSILYSREQWTPPVTPKNIEQWRVEPWEQTKQLYVCHSFVTDGRIQFLSDCTHELAGQTVDLPEFD